MACHPFSLSHFVLLLTLPLFSVDRRAALESVAVAIRFAVDAGIHLFRIHNE